MLAARAIQVAPSSSKDELLEIEDIELTETSKEEQPSTSRKEQPKKIKSFLGTFFPKPEQIEFHAELESDATYLASKEEIRQSRHCVGRVVSISPETMLMMYDVLFFSTYAIGWLMTYIWNPTGIYDNGVARVVKTLNICIGVDTYPARYVSIPMSYMFTIAFFLTVILFMKRMLDQRELEKRCSKVWRTGLLGCAMMMNLTFGWTIGVIPENPETFKMHLVGFIVALGGYALLKLASIIEFGFFADDDDGEKGLSCKDMCHTWRKLIFLTFEGLCCGVLSIASARLAIAYYYTIFLQSDDDFRAILNITADINTPVDFNTMPVLVVTVICPIVSQIIDPHRRHITISFKYQHPDEATHDGEADLDHDCKERCLDSPIPCSCCWKEDKRLPTSE